VCARQQQLQSWCHGYVEPPGGFWLGVERGPDLVFSETHTELDPALMRAESLKSPLIVAGWTEVTGH